jgi:hypothetical protein
MTRKIGRWCFLLAALCTSACARTHPPEDVGTSQPACVELTYDEGVLYVPACLVGESVIVECVGEDGGAGIALCLAPVTQPNPRVVQPTCIVAVTACTVGTADGPRLDSPACLGLDGGTPECPRPPRE